MKVIQERSSTMRSRWIGSDCPTVQRTRQYVQIRTLATYEGLCRTVVATSQFENSIHNKFTIDTSTHVFV